MILGYHITITMNNTRSLSMENPREEQSSIEPHGVNIMVVAEARVVSSSLKYVVRKGYCTFVLHLLDIVISRCNK